MSVVASMTIIDYLDILILTWLIYKLIKLVRETRAEQLLKGVFIVMIILLVLNQLEFKAMSLLSDTFFNVGIIAIIVMFQPELRRVLEKMGRTKVVKNIAFNIEGNTTEHVVRCEKANAEIAQACERLSKTCTGALIVMELQTRLGEQIDTGTVVNGDTTCALLCNIFVPNTPLHDGAVIIRDGRILAAACFLPKPLKEELVSKELGSRHRAAIGMSEVSDALIIVVSEETGTISVAENGELTRGFNKEKLKELLNHRLIPEVYEVPQKKQRTKKEKKQRPVKKGADRK